MVRTRFQQFPPYIRIGYFLLLMLFSGSLFVFFGMFAISALSGASLDAVEAAVINPEHPDYLSIIRILAVCNQVGSFLFAAWLFQRLFLRENPGDLMFQRFGRTMWILVPLVMAAALPLIDLLQFANEQIIPGGSWIEAWLKPFEEHATELTEGLLAMETFPSFILNVLILAALPALGEEIAFRGIVQPLCARWTGNIHAGIWIAAFIFSAVHLQFYGFVPRLLLGALFGYLLIWSGSIWPSVLAHFSNNLASIAIYYFFPGLTSSEWTHPGNHELNPWWIAGSVVVFSVVLFIMRRDSRWKFIRHSYLDKPAIDLSRHTAG